MCPEAQVALFGPISVTCRTGSLGGIFQKNLLSQLRLMSITCAIRPETHGSKKFDCLRVLGVKNTIKIGKTENGRETLESETTGYEGIDKTTAVAK